MPTAPGKAGATWLEAKRGKAQMSNTRSTTAADSHIGQRIRAARLECGLSQTELGEACDITFQQIQKYENGVNRVASARLEQISQKLGRPPSWFFARSDHAGNGSEPASAPDRASQMAADHYGSEIIEAYLALTPAQRSLMRDVFVAIAEAVKKG